MATPTKTLLKSTAGHQRVVINHVNPELDCGAFPIKRCLGEKVTVTANVFADGHDQLQARLLFRHESQSDWQELPFIPLGNDRWQATFTVDQIGNYFYTLTAWVDEFGTWQHDFKKKLAANQQTPLDFLTGAELITNACKQAEKNDKKQLLAFAGALIQPSPVTDSAFDPALSALITRYAQAHLYYPLPTRVKSHGRPRQSRVQCMV